MNREHSPQRTAHSAHRHSETEAATDGTVDGCWMSKALIIKYDSTPIRRQFDRDIRPFNDLRYDRRPTCVRAVH